MMPMADLTKLFKQRCQWVGKAVDSLHARKLESDY